MPHYQQHKRRWRDYHTAYSARPVKEFISKLPEQEAAGVAAAMKEVEEDGLVAARHLRGEIYEARADGDNQTFRILFAADGRHHHILLALDGFSKKTQKTPRHEIERAERTRANPDFPGLVEARLRERRLLRTRAARRAELGLSQTEVAARMRTSQSAVARLERGELDPKLSTVERYATAVGKKLEWWLEEATEA